VAFLGHPVYSARSQGHETQLWENRLKGRVTRANNVYSVVFSIFALKTLTFHKVLWQHIWGAVKS